MTSYRFTTVCAAGALVCGLIVSTPAVGGSIDRMWTGYRGYIPDCHDSWALATIAGRFAHKERRYWFSTASLDLFYDIREIAYRPWGPNFIPRRFCEAKVKVSPDASLPPREKSRVRYSIIEKAGFAGVGWGVEWCVIGYDRNLAFAPRCKMAGP